jgi:hypothetical protein
MKKYLLIFIAFFACNLMKNFMVSEKEAIAKVFKCINEKEIEDVKKLIISEQGDYPTLGKYEFDQMKPIVQSCYSSIGILLEQAIPETFSMPDGTIVDQYIISLNQGGCYDSTLYNKIDFKFKFYRPLSVGKVASFLVDVDQKKFNLPDRP